MSSTSTIVDEAEAFLRRRAAEITKPQEGECLCCYVVRLLDEFPCDNHLRHALHYRDVVAPRRSVEAPETREGLEARPDEYETARVQATSDR
jgi:hypothetical protein